ncbi:MAG TPA: DUF1802 family protein [Thermoanaerobaculia bacterium]|nr:DUF1802 family protein [Thermoanaerobaculia bacterium]
MNKLPDHTALKEWSTVIDALGRGEQIILIRKGGIADPTFGLEAERFYLYPTFFHNADGAVPESVTITHWAEAVKTWRMREVEPLVPLTVMNRAALEERYRFRPDQALHVIAVKTWKLAEPVTVPQKESYLGCRSWVSLDEEIDITGSAAVMEDAELNARIGDVERTMSAWS